MKKLFQRFAFDRLPVSENVLAQAMKRFERLPKSVFNFLIEFNGANFERNSFEPKTSHLVLCECDFSVLSCCVGITDSAWFRSLDWLTICLGYSAGDGRVTNFFRNEPLPVFRQTKGGQTKGVKNQMMKFCNWSFAGMKNKGISEKQRYRRSRRVLVVYEYQTGRCIVNKRQVSILAEIGQRYAEGTSNVRSRGDSIRTIQTGTGPVIDGIQTGIGPVIDARNAIGQVVKRLEVHVPLLDKGTQMRHETSYVEATQENLSFVSGLRRLV